MSSQKDEMSGMEAASWKLLGAELHFSAFFVYFQLPCGFLTKNENNDQGQNVFFQ